MGDYLGNEKILNLLLSIPPFLLALTVHEFTHGWIAYLKGDRTAAMQGRLTFNPIKHLDPIGSLAFILSALSSPVVIGWAKPVPVNLYNFRNPRKDNMLVALGGPVSNFLLAIVLAFIIRLLFWYPGPEIVHDSPVLGPLAVMLLKGIGISISLGIFNLIPVHPLDGSHILEGLLPTDKAMAYGRLAPYGFIILLALILIRVRGESILGIIIHPIYSLFRAWLVTLMGI